MNKRVTTIQTNIESANYYLDINSKAIDRRQKERTSYTFHKYSNVLTLVAHSKRLDTYERNVLMYLIKRRCSEYGLNDRKLMLFFFISFKQCQRH